MRVRAIVAAAVVLAALAALAIGGCSERQGPPPRLVVTTTTEVGQTTTTLPASVSTLPPRSVDDIRAALDAAIAGRDFCGVLAALDDASPDTADGAAVIAAYDLLAEKLRLAAAFRPLALSDAWQVVLRGVDEGRSAAHRVGGNVNDPTLRAPFIDGQFQAAMSQAETWADSHCTKP